MKINFSTEHLDRLIDNLYFFKMMCLKNMLNYLKLKYCIRVRVGRTNQDIVKQPSDKTNLPH